MKLHLTISCFVLYCGCHIPFEIWNSILKRIDFLEVIAINGRIILKCILKTCRSQWPRSLRRRSAAARLLKSWVQIPLGHGCLSVVSVVCCQVEVCATS